MAALDGITIGLIVGAAGLLVAASVSDIRTRRIPNQLTGSLALLGLVYVAALTAYGTTPLLGLWHILAALAVFAGGLGLFALGLMGGGDVKLMGAFGFFAGPAFALDFVLYTALFGGLVALATMMVAKMHTVPASGPPEAPTPLTVPYGVAITMAGLVGLGEMLTPFFV